MAESKIKYLRKQAALTQQQLSESAGINIRQIQKFENGEYKTENMTAKNLLAIADALGVDPHALLD